MPSFHHCGSRPRTETPFPLSRRPPLTPLHSPGQPLIWLLSVWSIHPVEYYLLINRNETLRHATMWLLLLLLFLAQSCLTLCEPLDCSPPGSSVHGILQARMLGWAAIPRQRIFPTHGRTCFSCIAGGFFTAEPTTMSMKRECHFAHRKKPDSKGHISPNSIYIKYQNRQVLLLSFKFFM